MNADDIAHSGSLRARDTFMSWGLALLWMMVIFFLSGQSDLGGMQWPPIFMALRKSGHIIEYAVLGILMGRALIVTWRARNGNMTLTRPMLVRAWWVGVMLATLYAVTDEFHQSFVPQRGAHIEDVVIDALSATAALGIWYIIQSNKRRTNNNS